MCGKGVSVSLAYCNLTRKKQSNRKSAEKQEKIATNTTNSFEHCNELVCCNKQNLQNVCLSASTKIYHLLKDNELQQQNLLKFPLPYQVFYARFCTLFTNNISLNTG